MRPVSRRGCLVHALGRTGLGATGQEGHQEGSAGRARQLLQGIEDGGAMRVELVWQRGQGRRHQRRHHKRDAQRKEDVHANDHPYRTVLVEQGHQPRARGEEEGAWDHERAGPVDVIEAANHRRDAALEQAARHDDEPGYQRAYRQGGLQVDGQDIDHAEQ